jgi:hypothetical protein
MRSHGAWVVLAALALGAPAAAQPASAPATQPASTPASQPAAETTAEEDLAAIEGALEADKRTAAPTSAKPASRSGSVLDRIGRSFQDLNADVSFILDAAVAGFSDKDPLMAGGHDPTKNGFNLQQLELYAFAMVDPYFRFDTNIVFSQFGVEIEEAYGTTLSLPWKLQVRAGQFLTRFGRINNSHPHTWAFLDQMLVLGKFFGGEGNRGLGAEVSWLTPLPWYVELVASATDAAGASTARSFFGANDLGVRGPGDLQYTLAAKQFFPLSDNWSLFWGLSAALGPNPTGRDNRSEIYGTDLYLKYRPITHGSYTIVSLDAEYLVRRRQVPGGVLQDQGLYAYLFWRFARRWAAAARYEWVQGVANDPLDPEWTEARQRLSANLTFWPTEFSRFRLQYSYDRPEWRHPYHAVFLAVEFAVGAHGAHKF